MQSKKTYKFQQLGSSYYIAVPKPFVSEQMLLYGVAIKIIESDENHLMLELIVTPQGVPPAMNAPKGDKSNGEHAESDKTGRKNTS